MSAENSDFSFTYFLFFLFVVLFSFNFTLASNINLPETNLNRIFKSLYLFTINAYFGAVSRYYSRKLAHPIVLSFF